MNETNQIIAVLVVRIFFGILMFMQGYDKLFRIKIKNVLKTLEYPYQGLRNLPKFFLIAGVYYTTYVEFIGGLFLIFGFLKHYCLYLMAIDLLIATIGFGIVNPLWDMKHVFPRFLMLVVLLIMPSQWDVISVDHFLTILNAINK